MHWCHTDTGDLAWGFRHCIWRQLEIGDCLRIELLESGPESSCAQSRVVKRIPVFVCIIIGDEIFVLCEIDFRAMN